MIKRQLIYQTHLCNGERLGFITGRGKFINVNIDHYPNSIFLPKCTVIIDNCKYKITSVEASEVLIHPSKTEKYLRLMITEESNEEKTCNGKGREG